MANGIVAIKRQIEMLRKDIERCYLRIEEYKLKCVNIKKEVTATEKIASALKKEKNRKIHKRVRKDIVSLHGKLKYCSRMIAMFAEKKEKNIRLVRLLLLKIKSHSHISDDSYEVESAMLALIDSSATPESMQKYAELVAKYTPERTPSDVDLYVDR